MLRFYKNFVKIFINDIVIYFYTLKKYLIYLRKIFVLFRNKCINLVSIKFFLNYSLVILFNQRVNLFEMFIFEKKIIAIISLRFFLNFKNLNHFLKLIK